MSANGVGYILALDTGRAFVYATNDAAEPSRELRGARVFSSVDAADAHRSTLRGRGVPVDASGLWP